MSSLKDCLPCSLTRGTRGIAGTSGETMESWTTGAGTASALAEALTLVLALALALAFADAAGTTTAGRGIRGPQTRRTGVCSATLYPMNFFFARGTGTNGTGRYHAVRSGRQRFAALACRRALFRVWYSCKQARQRDPRMYELARCRTPCLAFLWAFKPCNEKQAKSHKLQENSVTRGGCTM